MHFYLMYISFEFQKFEIYVGRYLLLSVQTNCPTSNVLFDTSKWHLFKLWLSNNNMFKYMKCVMCREKVTYVA